MQNDSILFLSNGHGEDTIGATIAAEVHALMPDLTIDAFPIVGTGSPYQKIGIKTIGPKSIMPSGGFVHHNPLALARDVYKGLVKVTFDQLAYLRRQGTHYRLIIVVGDCLGLYFNWLTVKKPLIMVNVADSMYYYSGKHRPFNASIISLMKKYCKFTYARDELTASAFRDVDINASFVGNPMMDSISVSSEPILTRNTADFQVIGLLPGTRNDAIMNLAHQINVCVELINLDQSSKYIFLVAWANNDRFPFDTLMNYLPDEIRNTISIGIDSDTINLSGRELTANLSVRSNGIYILTNSFGDILNESTIVIGLSGTGNEQACGLGKPVITFPTQGVQMTNTFVNSQSKLLGSALRVTSGEHLETAQAIRQILFNKNLYHTMSQAGQARMGRPGASKTIALAVKELLG